MSRDSIGITDLEGRILYMNSAGLALVGLDKIDRVDAAFVTDLFIDDQKKKFHDLIMPSINSTGSWMGEISLHHKKSGNAIPGEMNAFTNKDRKSGGPF